MWSIFRGWISVGVLTMTAVFAMAASAKAQITTTSEPSAAKDLRPDAAAPDMLPANPPGPSIAPGPSAAPNNAGKIGPATSSEASADNRHDVPPLGVGNDSDFGDYCPCLHENISDRFWFRGEALLWWVRGGETPPLLTTSPAGAPVVDAGVLGKPGTTVLFGDQELNTDLHAGSRMSFGLWLDRCEESGVEFSYMILGENTQTFGTTSNSVPILARPYFNVNPAVAAESSQLIAYPNRLIGAFNVNSTENFQGAEVLWRRAIVNNCGRRFDFLAGYRFQSLTDGLTITDSATASGAGAGVPAGTTINVTDLFHTRNEFNGGELGLAAQWQRNCWSLETRLKLGIGDTSTQVLINGSTTVVSNGASATSKGGLLALPGNIGKFDSDQASLLPELDCNLGYDLTPRLRATVGYTLLYWTRVARPGDQIDLNVDSREFARAIRVAGEPESTFHTTDFWAQGLNLGLEYRF